MDATGLSSGARRGTSYATGLKLFGLTGFCIEREAIFRSARVGAVFSRAVSSCP